MKFIGSVKTALGICALCAGLWTIAAFAEVDIDGARVLLDEQGAAIEQAAASLEDAQAADLASLRKDLAARRAAIEGLIEETTEERDALRRERDPAPVEEGAAQGPAGGDEPPGEEGAGSGETASAAERVDRLSGLLEEAVKVRADLDRLSGLVAEREKRLARQSGVDERRSAIAEIERALEQENLPTSDLVAFRERLRAVKAAAEDAIAPVRASRDELRADLDRLGPPPGEDAPAEAPEIAAEREALTRALLEEDALVRQSELNVAEIDRLLNEITARRRDQFYNAIFERGAFPFAPATVGSAAVSFLAGVEQLWDGVEAWRAELEAEGRERRAYGLIVISVVVGVFLFGPTRRWASGAILSGLEELEPTPGRRAGAAMIRILTRVVPGVIAGAVVLETLKSQGAIDATTAPVARDIWFGLLALLTVDAGASAVFAPKRPGWRLVPLQNLSAGIVRSALILLVVLYFLDRVLGVGAGVYGGDRELALVQSAGFSVAMALVLLLLSRKSVWKLEERRADAFDDDTKMLWRNARRILRVLAFGIIAAAFLGYVALAHYGATRIFMLAGLVAFGLFVRLIAHELIRAADRTLAADKPGAIVGESEQEHLVFFWIGAFIDLTIVLVLAPVAFLALGAEWADVRDTIADAFFGFKIGNVTVSIAQIFSAIGVFVLILGVTRFIQRTGEKRFFPRTRMDIGVQNSLKTLIGYVGLVFAFISGVSLLGFNLSNLAIIAGALSVGIGFGLQSIVNNFVSGLILLFERPIKVGDWIVTSSGEGTVRKISVRSTEIETFDRSSVIVPNSELISGAVTNWTHKNKIGRVIVPVGVSYQCDAETVIRLLEEVAEESGVLMRYPEPYVYFDSFGDSSLNFELRGYLRDVGAILSARTALRVAILKKLKAAGIEIPFPQRDIHIKDAALRAAAKDAEGTSQAAPLVK